MKRIFLATVLLLASSSSFAADKKEGHDGAAHKEGSPSTHSEEMFAMCDSNKDGKISKEEFTDEKMKMFQKYDKDNNGMLSKEEHQTMAEDHHKMMMEGHGHMKES